MNARLYEKKVKEVLEMTFKHFHSAEMHNQLNMFLGEICQNRFRRMFAYCVLYDGHIFAFWRGGFVGETFCIIGEGTETTEEMQEWMQKANEFKKIFKFQLRVNKTPMMVVADLERMIAVAGKSHSSGGEVST